jgi:hypothetical protein
MLARRGAGRRGADGRGPGPVPGLGREPSARGLAHVDRLLDYAWLEGTDPGGVSYEDYRAFLPAVGFRELTRTQRGWTLTGERAD